MQLWRAGKCSLASLLLTLVSASITRFWFISKNRFRRIQEWNAIWFTIPIIQNRRVSLRGPRTLAASHIRKIGILSEALCAFTKFTANGSSSLPFRVKSRNLLIALFGMLTKIAGID